MDGLALISVVLGAAGIGGLVTAVVQASIASKKAPVEFRNLTLEGNLTLVSAAEQLVGSQTKVVEARDNDIRLLVERVEKLEGRLKTVQTELAEERRLREVREGELASQRTELDKQAGTIENQSRQLRSQSARIGALKRAVTKLGGNPDEIQVEDEDTTSLT